MPERRYSDEEIAAIFKRAAETEPSASPVLAEGQGMTLEALQEIGREVGLSPDTILQAARSLETTGKPASRRFFGFPIGVGRTIQLDRPLSEAEWGYLVTDLRETFSARGKLKSDGPFRQWTNGNLQALIEPTPDGERLRLQTLAGGPRSLMRSGVTALGLAGCGDAGSVLPPDRRARTPVPADWGAGYNPLWLRVRGGAWGSGCSLLVRCRCAAGLAAAAHRSRP